MAFKHYTSFSLVFLATATILLAGHAHGTKDLCQEADYKALCRAVVKGLSEPHAALKPAIHLLIIESRRAFELADKQGKSMNVPVCKQNFDDAIDNLQKCLKNLKNRDFPRLKINLSAALSDYMICDYAITVSAFNNPISKNTALLRHMASNCLYLSSLLH
jgi:hypothetical protein